jgi:hypothetical protein
VSSKGRDAQQTSLKKYEDILKKSFIPKGLKLLDGFLQTA